MSKQTSFGKRLRELRKAKTLTQRELAAKVAARLRKHGRSFDFTYLSKIENDKAQPSVELIEKIAEVLGADVNELIALAGKAPREFLEKTLKGESARTFFRSAFDRALTEEDWKRLVQELKSREKGS